MKKVSGVRPICEGGDELRQAENVLAETLREANVGGLTTAIGMKKRLDYGLFSSVDDMRTLIGIVLNDWGMKNDPNWTDEKKEYTEEELQNSGLDKKNAEKVVIARRLRRAVEVFEECLKKKENAA